MNTFKNLAAPERESFEEKGRRGKSVTVEFTGRAQGERGTNERERRNETWEEAACHVWGRRWS